MKKKLKRYLHLLDKKNELIGGLLKGALFRKRQLFYFFRKAGCKVEKKTVLFTAYRGRSYSCSPKAIYEYMLNNDKYQDYHFIWAFKNVAPYEFLLQNRNTTIVKYPGREFEKCLAKVEYIVSNWRLPEHIYPRRHQKFLQCWHGTPLKRLGFDIERGQNAKLSMSQVRKNYLRDAQKITYMLSPSRFATEKFISSFNLAKLNKADCIIEKGYPRNDFLYNFTDEDIIRVKKLLGLEHMQKKIILYAPTWRDNQHTTGVGYTLDLGTDFDKLRMALQDEYIILFRAHYLVANKFDFAKYAGFIYDVSHIDDINDLYIISDLLITDYSSVFFDYANLKRPMIFYMYDLDLYQEILRGFYLDLEELPGPIVRSENELIAAIKNSTNVDEEVITRFNKKFNYLEDGQAAKRVVEEVFQ